MDTSFVKAEDIVDHLKLLQAFSNLRLQCISEEAWHSDVAASVVAFRSWAHNLESLDRLQVRTHIENALPSLNVLMVWHTYLLNPVKYQHDSVHIYPALSAAGAFPLRQSALLLETLPSFAPITTVSGLKGNIALNDLDVAVDRQASFISKVVALGWTPSVGLSFADRCIRRYRQFLDLIKVGSSTSIVPTLDIDLAWHTHQLQADKYCAATTGFLGRVLNHDDNIPKAELKENFGSTELAWVNRFGSPYLVSKGAASGYSSACSGDCGAREIAGCSPGACSGEYGIEMTSSCSSACSAECGTQLAACGEGGCDGSCGTEAIAA